MGTHKVGKSSEGMGEEPKRVCGMLSEGGGRMTAARFKETVVDKNGLVEERGRRRGYVACRGAALQCVVLCCDVM